MPGFGYSSEFLLIFIVALLVFGPKRLPELAKSLGRAMHEFKRSMNEFKNQIETEVGAEKIKEEKKTENALREKSGGQGQQGNRKKNGQGNNQRGGSSGSAGNMAQNGQPGQSGQSQGLSRSDINSMLRRQSAEEKSLRNYFQPGKKEDPLSRREAQIEQMLRSMGAPVPNVMPQKPGAPYIEKDW